MAKELADISRELTGKKEEDMVEAHKNTHTRWMSLQVIINTWRALSFGPWEVTSGAVELVKRREEGELVEGCL